MGEGSPREVLRASARTANGEGRRGSAGPGAGLPLQPRWLPGMEAGRAGGELAGASGASKQLCSPGWRRRPGPQQEQAWGCREGRAASPLPPILPRAGQVLPRTANPAPVSPRFQKGPCGLDCVSHFPPRCE